MTDTPTLFLRVNLGGDVQMGPGKARLLDLIEETGSIAEAGRRMGMSYKRAWYLVDSLNGHFKEPLVVSSRGGKSGGGARLTDMGREVRAAFARMEATAKKALEDDLKAMQQLVAPPPSQE